MLARLCKFWKKIWRQRLRYQARLRRIQRLLTVPPEYITQLSAQKLAAEYAPLQRYFQKRRFNLHRQVRRFRRGMADFDRSIARLNQKFIRQELKTHKKLFDNIGGKSLDKQQRRAIVTDAQNNLILAGAGSGKTLTIAGKVQYLVQVRNVDPQKILVLSFTRKAVQELQERIVGRLGTPIQVWTFHQLGLRILRQQSQSGIAGEELLSQTIQNYLARILPQVDALFLNALRLSGIQARNTEELTLLKKQAADWRSADWPLAKLAQLSRTFINLLKSSGRAPADLIIPPDAADAPESRATLFLPILAQLFARYQAELAAQNKLDFHDMINQAAWLVREQGSPAPYRYIIIDEYQDISLSRFQLIKAIREKTGAKLICVGDDWQSIYRFAGSEVSLFTDFQQQAGPAELLRIERTYRNSQNLINIAAKFIQANPAQLQKKLASRRRVRQPLRIIKYGRGQERSALEQAILNIVEEYGEKKSLLILGRHQRDIQEFLPVSRERTRYQLFQFDAASGKLIYTRRPKLNINYLTAHKAKGLEADNVIVLNLSERALGFPNQITDDPLLSLVLAQAESFPLAEERRLFYVAITRTRHTTYLLAARQKPSRFVTECAAYRDVRVSELARGDKPLLCPRCQSGHLTILTRRGRQFWGCENQPWCGYKIPES
ncbi:MAG: UvrD-helicase domain-containing protein [Candidatus Margulisbacteria bacterium]|jgi:superfamily I DNA/RNA helicase|nr:UvrD-helicase domain-containing protein [Candidatus Margulisiibacteriota bacterium]